MACSIHSGVATAVILDGRAYCARCQRDMTAAAARLDAHVTPRVCFVWYENTRAGWQPIPGTGCAHYVAHQKNIRNGSQGQKCVAGYTFRVAPCLSGLTQVTGGLGAVQVGDIWVSVARDHTGIVTGVVPPAAGAAVNTPPAISITHASSAQHALATNLFATYFHSAGDFFR